MDGEVPEPHVLRRELHAAVARGSVQPVVAVDATTGVGLAEVLDLLRGFPGPGAGTAPAVERPDGGPVAPLDADPDGPVAGTLLGGGLLRLWSGRLPAGSLLVDGEPVEATPPPCTAGDVCLVPGLPDRGLLSSTAAPLVTARR